MAKISIASASDIVIFDWNVQGTAWGDMTQRVSRTSTLDGGVAMQSFGMCHGDRTFSIVPVSLTPEQAEKIIGMVENSASVTLCCPEGAFSGLIYSFNAQTQKIVFWPEQKI